MKSSKYQIITVIFFVIVLSSLVYSKHYETIEIQERENAEINTRVAVAKQNAAVAVPRVFSAWSESAVTADNIVEKWSGVNSELLFYSTNEFCESYNSITIPCWEVYAKTKSSNRYFVVQIDVDPKVNSRYVTKKRLRQIELQEVINAAIHSGRSDVVKRLGVIEKPA